MIQCDQRPYQEETQTWARRPWGDRQSAEGCAPEPGAAGCPLKLQEAKPTWGGAGFLDFDPLASGTTGQ